VTNISKKDIIKEKDPEVLLTKTDNYRIIRLKKEKKNRKLKLCAYKI